MLMTRTFVAAAAALSTLAACGSDCPRVASARTAVPAVAPHRSTQEVLDHHLAAFDSFDLGATLADYSEKSMFLSPIGTFRGLDQIQELYTDVYDEFSANKSKLHVTQKLVEGDVAFVYWTAETGENRYEMGTETFVVEDGKIVYQTFTGKITSKIGQPIPLLDNPGRPDYPAPGTTASVVLHHFDSADRGDLPGVLMDYADDMSLLSWKGEIPRAGLDDLFKGLLIELAQPGSRSKLLYMAFDGELGFVVWAADTPTNRYELAADTFVVRNGKIRAETLGALVEPKNAAPASGSPAGS